METVHARQNTN
jgi:hypothetical protein